MFLLFGLLLLKIDFMYFVYFMCWSYVCTQGNMAEQPVAECFTLYKYIEKKNTLRIRWFVCCVKQTLWQRTNNGIGEKNQYL